MKISIITINYNNLEGLRKTMTSSLGQTYFNKEYIIIDGGSIDGSREYISLYSTVLHYWVSEKDDGLYNAMNKGIEQSTGDYLIFMNSGDEFFNESVLEDIFLYKTYYADVLYGSTIYNYPNGEILRHPRMLEIMDYELPFCHQSCFVKGNLMRNEKFDESFCLLADYAFFLQCYRRGGVFQKISKIVSIYDTDGLSASSDFHKQIYKERCQIRNKKESVFVYYGELLKKKIISALKIIIPLGIIEYIKKNVNRFAF